MAGTLLYETTTAFGHYQVWDMVYNGRLARVLYSGNAMAAQSGIPRDENSDMLFDYNQRFYAIASALLPSKVLIIGGGAYTLPSRIIQTLQNVQVDVVEIDPGLDDIAVRYFDLTSNQRLNIIHESGMKYLENNTMPYDVIFIDVFSHTTIPKEFTTKWTSLAVKRNLKPDGLVGVNIISAYVGRNADVIEEQISVYEPTFSSIEIFPATRNLSLWMPQNLVLIAQSGKPKPIDTYIGYEPLK